MEGLKDLNKKFRIKHVLNYFILFKALVSSVNIRFYLVQFSQQT